MSPPQVHTRERVVSDVTGIDGNLRLESHTEYFSNSLSLVFLSLSRSTYQSCWLLLDFHSSIPVTCWTWWTMRSWLNRPRRAETWWTRPSATTCCLTRGRRCRRPGRGRDSPQVRLSRMTYPSFMNHTLAAFLQTQKPVRWLTAYLTKNVSRSAVLNLWRWCANGQTLGLCNAFLWLSC